MNGLLINGQWLQGDGQLLISTSPADGEHLWQAKAASADQVQQAVDAARQAFLSWRNTSPAERQAIAREFARQLEDHQQILAETISAETGKPLWESHQEVSAMINKVAISIHAQETRAGRHTEAGLALSHQPHGVMAVFGPYNFPGHLPNGHIVPALLAGNTVVFKPSEKTPLVAQRTLECWQAAGLPDGVINLVQGGSEVGEALVAAPINGLLFTGSHRVGALIHAQLAGRPEVLLALELGGNNPLIVDEVSNVEVAAWHVIRSAFITSGQRCTCARRLILVGDNALDVLEKVESLLPRLTIGKWHQQPFMGPVIDAAAARQILEMQARLAELGGHIRVAAKILPAGDAFVSPGIIAMPGKSTLCDEEVFGPLLQVYRVDTIQEAIDLANDTRFGLAAGLISDNSEHQQLFLNAIKAGVVSINQPTAGASSKLPFGGVGLSGNHRPSAFYAADYCAWPQSQSLGEPTSQQVLTLPMGIV